MNADAFRHLYDYHFAENRKMWDEYIPLLSQEQFILDLDYSHGSVRNQIVHMINVDDTWFSALRGLEFSKPLDPVNSEDRKAIRAQWDKVEQGMRVYLSDLRDDMLTVKPFPAGEDQDLRVWQVLLHVANHGTDHRAQILRILHDFGVKTSSQDYIFYVYDHLI